MSLPTNSIVTGDCFDVLGDFPPESVHAIVTDPPYALGDGGFMGRDWDKFSDSKAYQKWSEEWAKECYRVIKPGGHLLAFGGNTRHHRLFSGVEDAGFEVRDTLTWHYGSGFPKALDVSKALDGVLGKQSDSFNHAGRGDRDDLDGEDGHNEKRFRSDYGYTFKPESEAAREWDGFKTALKPATEFIVLARKPFEGTVAENVQEHGTGALNIDGCRIVTDDSLEGGATGPNPTMRTLPGDERTEAGKGMFANPQPVEPGDGRYPANVIFDGEAAKILDRAVGEQPASGRYPGRDRGPDDEDLYDISRPGGEGDSEKLDGGGPSRYFKTTGREGEATADKRYPDEGGTDFSMKPGLRRHDEGGTSRFFYTSKANRAERTLDGRIENDHPTVKPQDLMEWLVKLVTAEDQIVLDPFAGSGTTAAACKALNRQFVAIEMDERYADIARVRTGLTPEDPSTVRDDEGQAGLEAFGGDD